MPSETNIEYTEKRLMLRCVLRLPVVVSGCNPKDRTVWSEPTETENISSGGALLRLRQEVAVGENLHVRSYCPHGNSVKVQACIVRIIAGAGSARVGIVVTSGAEQWIRHFVAWIADGQQPETKNP